MTIYLNPTEEQKENAKIAKNFHELKGNWKRLLEVIIGDSSVEELEAFALRLSEIQQYTREQEYARLVSRYGYTGRGVWYSEHGTPHKVWEKFDPPLKPVETIALSPSQLKKGKKLWTITI